MAVKPETKLRKKFVDKLEKIPGILVFSIQQVSLRGHPDLIICLKGEFVAIELKSYVTAELVGLQKYFQEEIIKAGGTHYIVHPYNWQNVIEELEAIAKTN
jgi:hypothetical protein